MIGKSDDIVNMQQLTVDRGTNKNILNIEEFVLHRGELVAVVGPNGAGKSTFLQTVNLLHPWHGELELFGENCRSADKTMLRRRCAMVFQEMLLLNDTVFNNVALALKIRGIARNEIKERVYQALTDFRCDHLALRSARTLSGGETQRVCIARALVANPELLLLDEPFAALDGAARIEMLEEIRQLVKIKKIAVILVSHYFTDVLHFAARAVVLFGGSIVQDDRPEFVMHRPVDQEVARLVGMDNIIPCYFEQDTQGLFIKLTNGIRFLCPEKVSRPINACCLPGDAFQIYHESFSGQHGSWTFAEGVVEEVTPGIGSYYLHVNVGGHPLRVRLPRNQVQDIIHRESNIKLAFKSSDAHIV